MRSLLVMASLVVGALALNGAAAQQAQQQQGSDGEAQVTGIVTSADEQTREITIEGKTFVMEGGGGAALFPHAGDKVTLFYEEKGGENVITRIGQAQ